MSYDHDIGNTMKVVCLDSKVIFQKRITQRMTLEGDPADIIKLMTWPFHRMTKTDYASCMLTSGGDDATKSADSNYNTYCDFGVPSIGDYLASGWASAANVVAMGIINEAGSFPENYKIQAYYSGIWNDVSGTTVTGETRYSRIIVFSAPVSCTGVRVYITSAGSISWHCLEVEVYVADGSQLLQYTGSTIDDFGYVLMSRVNYDSKLKAINNVKNTIQWKFWIDPSTEYVHFEATRGTDKSAYVVFEDGINCLTTNYEYDYFDKVDNVFVLGRGEGRNQLVSYYPTTLVSGGSDYVEVFREGLDLATLDRYAEARWNDLHSPIQSVKMRVYDYDRKFVVGDTVTIRSIASESHILLLNTTMVIVSETRTFDNVDEVTELQLTTLRKTLAEIINDAKKKAIAEGYEQGSIQTFQISAYGDLQVASGQDSIGVGLTIPPTWITVERADLSFKRGGYMGISGEATSGGVTTSSASFISGQLTSAMLTNIASTTSITTNTGIADIHIGSSFVGITAYKTSAMVTASGNAGTGNLNIAAAGSYNYATCTGVGSTEVTATVASGGAAGAFGYYYVLYQSSPANVVVQLFDTVVSTVYVQYQQYVNADPNPVGTLVGSFMIPWNITSHGVTLRLLSESNTLYPAFMYIKMYSLYAHTHIINDPEHATYLLDSGHITPLDEPYHYTSGSDFGHHHGLNDPSHGHRVRDSGHIHILTDLQHFHSGAAGGGGVSVTMISGTISGVRLKIDNASSGLFSGEGPYNIASNFEIGKTYLLTWEPGDASAKGSLTATVSVRGYAFRREDET